jgi:hypothetical protein
MITLDDILININDYEKFVNQYNDYLILKARGTYPYVYPNTEWIEKNIIQNM